MSILLVSCLGLIVFVTLLLIPSISISMLLMVPLVKPVAVAYLPILQSIDLTVTVNLVVAVLGLRTYFSTKSARIKLHIPWPLLINLIIIAVVFLLGLTWTTAPNYGEQKIVRMIGIGIPFLLLPALFIRTNTETLLVMKVLILVAGFVAFMLLFGPVIDLHTERYGNYYGRRTFLGSDPNTPAVVIMVGILLVVLYLIAGLPSRWVKLYGMVFVPLGVIAILASGSRANLVGLITTFLFIPFLNKGSNSRKVMVIGIISFVVILALIIFLPLLSTDIPMTRWQGFYDQLKAGDLTTSRTPAWIFCITQAWDQYVILGHGPGSYAKDFLGADAQYYPHNIILESLYEAGLVGLLAILAFFYQCFSIARRGMKLARSKEERFLVAAPSAIVLSMSVTALTHWNLDSARFLYLFAGILSSVVACLIAQIRYEHRIRQQENFTWFFGKYTWPPSEN